MPRNDREGFVTGSLRVVRRVLRTVARWIAQQPRQLAAWAITAAFAGTPAGAQCDFDVTFGGESLPALHVAGTGFGEVSALLVDGGLCDSDDVDPSWNGSVVLCERGTIAFFDKVNNVGNTGGLAVVLFNNSSGSFFATCAGGCTVSIPGLSLSQEDGLLLLGGAVGGESVVTAGGPDALFCDSFEAGHLDEWDSSTP